MVMNYLSDVIPGLIRNPVFFSGLQRRSDNKRGKPRGMGTKGFNTRNWGSVSIRSDYSTPPLGNELVE
jgi:hypothetical protein